MKKAEEHITEIETTLVLRNLEMLWRPEFKAVWMHSGPERGKNERMLFRVEVLVSTDKGIIVTPDDPGFEDVQWDRRAVHIRLVFQAPREAKSGEGSLPLDESHLALDDENPQLASLTHEARIALDHTIESYNRHASVQ